jgi:hypothetical protein
VPYNSQVTYFKNNKNFDFVVSGGFSQGKAQNAVFSIVRTLEQIAAEQLEEMTFNDSFPALPIGRYMHQAVGI